MVRAGRSILVLAALAGTLLMPSAAEAGGGSCLNPVRSRHGDTVEIRGFCFSPTVLEVPEGTVVTFVNRDPTRHNVMGANEAFGRYEGLRPEESIRHRFNEAGVIPYACTLHPGMMGAVLVGDGSSPGTVAAPTGADLAGADLSPDASRGQTPWKPVALVSMAAALVAILGALRQRAKAG